MQPSNQQGVSDRFGWRLEELCWENRQLLAATSIQNTHREKATAGSAASSYTLSVQMRENDHALKVADVEDERLAEATAFTPGVDLTDWLDNLDPGGPIAMQRNTLPPSLISSQSDRPFTDIKGGDPSPHQMASVRGELEDLARLCGPSLQNGHLNLDARVERSAIPPLPFTITQDDLSKVSDAMLNRIASRCMGSSSLQSLENAHLNHSVGDAMASNAPLMNPNLPGSSNTNSHSSIEISPSSDLESVLLDSGGSGFTPNQGGKIGEVLGGKKARAIDDLDSDSEGSFDDVVAPRKPRQEQGPSSKRMRAAETHNESERKRRGRINEKLKALQELIPNANKTDKASVLTEAIDYLKKLRLQLQVMCCRNGFLISPLLVSQGMQHPQMPHAGASLNVERDAGVALGGSVRLPLTSNTAAQERSLPMELPAFNGAPFVPPTTLVPSSRAEVVFEPTADLSRPVSFPHPFQV
ncbi:hypothetical protein GOP47_0021748 [Adiantum capillus-veneris]|uniref:BHLH domain-containing protein n=1 Tax=Adiantum capillus-veneris TaxID=13818 RepID=A0A9D4U809_ADICA|nr:hypothetical protein GOP47_0021748 [Adiantum capillus-veneris]